MTRETKVGMVVSCSFLCLVGVVLASKLRDGEPNSGTMEETGQVAAASQNQGSTSDDDKTPRTLPFKDKDTGVLQAGLTTERVSSVKSPTLTLPTVEPRPALGETGSPSAPAIAPPDTTPPTPGKDGDGIKDGLPVIMPPTTTPMPEPMAPKTPAIEPPITPPGAPMPEIAPPGAPVVPEKPTPAVTEGPKPEIKEAGPPAAVPATPPSVDTLPAPASPVPALVTTPMPPEPATVMPVVPATPADAVKPIVAPKPSELNVLEPAVTPPMSVPMPPSSPPAVPVVRDEPPVVTAPIPMPMRLTPEPSAPSPRPATPGVIARGGTGGQPNVEIIDEEEYVIQPGDTYAAISQMRYGSDRFAEALRQYNEKDSLLSDVRQKDGTLKKGQRITIPPAEILSKRHPATLVRTEPAAPELPAALPKPMSPLTDVPDRVRPVPVVTPPERTVPGVPTSSGAATRSFRVRGNGQTMREVARLTLGNGDRWQEVYHLNPQHRPDFQVPAGTTLKLPVDAKIPSEE